MTAVAIKHDTVALLIINHEDAIMLVLDESGQIHRVAFFLGMHEIVRYQALSCIRALTNNFTITFDKDSGIL